MFAALIMLFAGVSPLTIICWLIYLALKNSNNQRNVQEHRELVNRVNSLSK